MQPRCVGQVCPELIDILLPLSLGLGIKVCHQAWPLMVVLLFPFEV